MKIHHPLIVMLLVAALFAPAAAQISTQQEAVKCKCGSWEKIDLFIHGVAQTPVRCVGSPPVFPALSTDPVKVVPVYHCSVMGCIPAYKFRVDAGPLQPLPMTFLLPLFAAGTHTVRVYAYCAKQLCDSCAFRLDVKEGPPPTCACRGPWTSQFVTWGSAAAPIKVPFQCNQESNLVNGPPAGTPVTVTASYACQPAPPCTATYKWCLNGNPMGPAPATWTAPAAGNYRITLIAYCGQIKCDSCWVRIKFPTGK